MKVAFYPTLAETIELHSRLIERFGGKDGVRDLGLLESALQALIDASQAADG